MYLLFPSLPGISQTTKPLYFFTLTAEISKHQLHVFKDISVAIRLGSYTLLNALSYSRNISPSRPYLLFASLLQDSPCTSNMCCVGSTIKGRNRINRTLVDLAQEPRKHRFSILTDFPLYTTSFHIIENLRNPHI